MGKTSTFRLTLALTKTFFIMHVGLFTQAQVLRVKNGVFKDTTNVYAPTITGGTVSGDALVFGATTGNMILMTDQGKANFTGGFTLKSEVWFEETPNYFFSMKFGSYCISFMSGGKMTSNWMTFPSEPIFTNKAGQYNYYPVGTELLNGYQTLPLKQWVNLEYSYDESTGITTTKINGVVDRVLNRYRGGERVQNQPNQPFKFFENAKNMRVREISFTQGRPISTPTLNIQANGLPFRNQVLITFDQMDPKLNYPFTAYVYMFRPGGLTTAFTMKIKAPGRKDTVVPMPAYTGKAMTVQIKVPGIERNFVVENRSSPSPFGGRFPIVAYHAHPRDFKLLASLGFSVIQNDFNVMGSGGDPAVNIQQSLDSAKKYNLGVYVVAHGAVTKQGYISRFKAHPNLYGWYLADEPGGADLLDTIRAYNNAVKANDQSKPTMVMMNNFNRLVGLDCDIMGVDPFPLPNISLRMMADATKAAIRATNDTKPVLTLMPHYNLLIPNQAELKAMSWISVIAGAHGIGIFEWDHRSLSTPNGYYTGANATQVNIIKTVFNEMRTYDWMLPAKSIGYTTGNLAIHACTKTANGKTMLIMANDSRKAESATFIVNGKTISIALAAYEVRIVDLNAVSPQGGRMALKAENGLTGNWENDQWLNYRIDFQQDLSQKQETIRITDHLSQFLDVSRIELTGSSHPFQVETDETTGRLAFTLSENPYSLSAGPGQKASGYVEFRVPVRPETPAGTELLNQAELFSGTDHVVNPEPTIHVYQPKNEGFKSELEQAGHFSAYPNPGQNQLNVNSTTDGQLHLVDLTGRTLTFDLVEGNNSIPVDQLSNGMYYLKLNGETQKWVKSN